MTSTPRRRAIGPRLILLLTLSAASLPGCAAGHHQPVAETGPLAEPLPTVVTPLHYWESGRRAVTTWLARHPDLAAAAEGARAACVRIEVRTAQHGSSYTETQGSGFLVGDRHVLTSGHTLSAGGAGSVRVTLSDGRSFDARVITSSYREFESTNSDLALLELDCDEALPGLDVTAPRVGTTVLALGYPGKHGLNDAGQVVSGQAYREAALEPLMVAAVVEQASPVVLRPVAGAIITGGMSGSPVIDATGRVLGVLNQSVSEPGRDGVTYSFEAASSVEWAALLEELGAARR